TRAEGRISASRREVDRNAHCYRRHQSAMCRLGMKPGDSLRYRPLSDSDLKNLHVHARKPAGLGENQIAPAWFWGGDRDADDLGISGLDELTEEELRVRWFRLRASRQRFEEEIDILRAELERTTRTYQHMHSVWQRLADRAGQLVSDGQKAYALKQASI
ncbi:hypothetical protein AURDEDRAFT_21064, partial [Auricularia subglabra TFB-10046 SS5]